MKKITFISLLLLTLAFNVIAQQTTVTEKYGKTINAGVGLGYFGYVGYNIPVFHINYEFELDENLTIAPFVTLYTYHNNYYYWGDNYHTYRNYSYTETVIPIGAKVTYYFDELFKAKSKWDFYLAGSLGFIIRKTVWETDYYGRKVVNPGTGPLYIDFHAGSEYHLSKKTGLFLDLSTGFSTFGVAFHL